MAGRFSVDAVFRAVDQMTAPIRKMQEQTERFAKQTERGFKQLNGAADAWLGGLAKASKVVAASTVAVGAALAAAAQPGMEFEQSMADLGASYLKTRGEINELETAALRLGKSTKFSATDVVKAMEELSKAGYSESDALKAIDGMTYAAAASGEDLVSTTLSVSSAMNAMGVPTERAIEVADKLALISVKTKSSISSLAESLSKAGPTARQLGVSFDDAAKMAGLLQSAGVDAAEAGTSVGTMLTMLAKPTDKARAMMKRLGVSFEDANGDMKQIPEVLAEFGKAASKSKGNMKQLAFFAELLGLRGQRAALNLQKMLVDIDPETGLPKWEALTKQVDKAAGTSKKMSDLRMATLTGDLDQLVETVKSLGIELYSTYSKNFREAATAMKEWFEKEGPGYLKAFGEKVQWVRDHFDQIIDVLKRVGRVVGVITAAAFATKAWSAALTILSATPAVLILYAIVAVLALIVAFWPEISAFFVSLGSLIADVCRAIWKVIVGVFSVLGMVLYAIFVQPAIALFTFLYKAVAGIFIMLWGASSEYARAAFATLMDFLNNVVLAFFKDFWRIGLWDAVVNVFSNLWDFFGRAVDRIKEIYSPLTDFFRDLWSGIVGMFSSVLGPVFDKIAGAVESVKGLLGWSSEEGSGEAPVSSAPPQVVSPQERVAKSVSETTTTNVSELLIRDQTGRANFTANNPGPGVRMSLARSGGL